MSEKEVQIDCNKIKDYLDFKVKLLEEEIEALRSVISEFDLEKSCYTQWHKAEAIANLRNYLK
jgi:hypothetical protein